MNLKFPDRYVSLHNHGGMSVGDGIDLPSMHMDYILSIGGDAWSLTDHGVGSGLAHAHKYAKELKKKGQKYRQLYGIEFYFVPSLIEWRESYENHREKMKQEKRSKKESKADLPEDEDVGHIVESEEESKKVDSSIDDEWKRRYHLVVVAKNHMGLSNLFTLCKRSFQEGFYKFPRIDFDMLKKHGEGLVVSTACTAGLLASRSIRSNALKKSDEKIQGELENYADRFVDAVGRENFFLELQWNDLDVQHTANRHIISLSKKIGIPLITTTDSHYSSPDKWESRELYRQICRISYYKDQAQSLPKKEDLKASLHPKNAEEMWDEFLRCQEKYDLYKGDEDVVRDSIERGHDVAWQLCDEVWFDTKAKLPNFSTKEKTAHEQLKELVWNGLVEEGLDEKKEYVERAMKELEDIKYLGFENYFLILYKVLQNSEKKILFGCGRGSGAGSLVNYALKITHVDPLKYDLLWERFLGRHRKSWPDIDTDCSNRDILIEEAKKLFGDDNVIPVSNFNTLKLKSLVKDVSKFYSVPFDEVNTLTNTVQQEVEPYAREEDEEKSVFTLTHDDCMKYSTRYRTFMEKYPDVERNIKNLFMQNRSLGTHAGGVIIAPNLEKFMPLMKVRGQLQTSWSEGLNWRNLEDNGFLKFDFLGLTLLRMIEECIGRILEEKNKRKPTFEEVRNFFDERMNCRYTQPEDQSVFKHVYQEGHFTGIFQFTNSGARQFCQDIKPTNIIEISNITAMYRPGPLKADVHKKYVKSKKDPNSIKYDHPVIEEILKKTCSLITYQEQFMLLGQKLAGFTPEESDQMRKTLVKKSLDTNDQKSGERVELRKKFVEGAKRLHNLDEMIANKLFDEIEYFSLYGFNFSHSISYSIDSYYTAWLHTYYEKEWLATCLQSEVGSPEGLAKMIGEIKAQGYKFSFHDINLSKERWVFDEDSNSFIPPLISVKGIGDNALREILEKRPFKSLQDFFYGSSKRWQLSKVNKTCLSALCRVGALNNLEEVRSRRIAHGAQLHSIIIDYYDQLKNLRKKKNDARTFDQLLTSLIEQTMCVEDWTRREKIEMLEDLTSRLDEKILFSDSFMKKIQKSSIRPLSGLKNDERDIVWFCVLDKISRKTKNNKTFHKLKVVDTGNEIKWLRVWGDMTFYMEKFSLWIADVQNSKNWGPSCGYGKLKKLEINV